MISITVAASFFAVLLVLCLAPPGISEPKNSSDKATQSKTKTQSSVDMSALGMGACFPIEIEGEVVDAWCWASGVMGAGRGPEHYNCGLRCVAGGVSIGIVDDENRLYIAAKSKAYKGCQELLAPLLGKRVKIKCYIAERGNCRLLGKVADVKDLGPAEKFYKKKK